MMMIMIPEILSGLLMRRDLRKQISLRGKSDLLLSEERVRFQAHLIKESTNSLISFFAKMVDKRKYRSPSQCFMVFR